LLGERLDEVLDEVLDKRLVNWLENGLIFNLQKEFLSILCRL
jgi:hypothetical protein